MAASLSAADIQLITKVYCKTLSITETANQTGFSFGAVKRYVEIGDPNRGIPSIREQMAKSIRVKRTTTPSRFIEQSLQSANNGSKVLLRGIKELFALKVSAMLEDFRVAYESEDETKINATKEKWFPELKFKDLSKILETEQLVWGQPLQGSQPAPAHSERAEKIAEIKKRLREQNVLLNQKVEGDDHGTVASNPEGDQDESDPSGTGGVVDDASFSQEEEDSTDEEDADDEV